MLPGIDFKTVIDTIQVFSAKTEDTGDLGKLEIPGKWKVGDLPTTGEEPDFWKEKPENGVEAETRNFSVNWQCCDPEKTKRKAKVDNDP